MRERIDSAADYVRFAVNATADKADKSHITASMTALFNEALELAARECEKKVTPSYQGGGVAIDSENYAVKSCAAAIRKLKV